MNMYRVEYSGDNAKLIGKTALAREHEDRTGGDTFLVQFDDFDLIPLCYGWHAVQRSDFTILDKYGPSSEYD